MIQLISRAAYAFLVLVAAACSRSTWTDEVFNVGPGGGTISLASGVVALTFPSGAVTASVNVTATPSAGPGGATVVPGTVFELSPSMSFSAPVQVAIQYVNSALPAGVRPAELGLYKVVGGGWAKVASSAVDTTRRMVTASLSSFSTYGILGAPVATVAVAPASGLVQVGATLQVSATPKDSGGAALPGRPVAWASSNPAIATVSNSGLVTGVAVGTDTITATSEGVGGKAAVTVQSSSGALAVFQDSFDSGARAADQSGYGWDGLGGVVTVSNDRAHSGAYSLKFKFGPDPLGTIASVSGTGTNGSFTRTSGAWTPNEWTTNGTASLVWLLLANGSLVPGVPFTVTSNDSIHIYFSGNATGAVSAFGQAPYGNQGSAEAAFHFGAHLTEVWLEYQWFVPSNYAHRLNNQAGAASANNKSLVIWDDNYSGTDEWLVGLENYPNIVGTNPQFTATGTSWFRPTSTSSNGGISDTPSPQVNLAGQSQIYIGAGGYVVPGQWNLIRVHLKASSAYGVADGVIEYWANGTLIFQKTDATNYGATGARSLTLHHGYLMGPANSGFTQETDFYIDDFKIFNTNPGW